MTNILMLHAMTQAFEAMGAEYLANYTRKLLIETINLEKGII